ncbi:hypothetical protein SLS55_001147 [Diplodia seriata]|uniref:DEAD/DEAH-box helicase domain-containing protein n=1 Tax=Diplodia seriata TaxID=420778 RepID=A0ABR3CWB6_9PEZI
MDQEEMEFPVEARQYDEHAPYARLMSLVKQMPQNDGNLGDDFFSMATYLPHLVKGESNFILFGPTPSGKTVTMLFGIVERVQKHVNTQGHPPSSCPKPKGLVIVPSDYLCRKTADLARLLIRDLSDREEQAYTITVLSVPDLGVCPKGGSKNGADIIITTPTMLAKMHQLGSIDWSETLILGLDDVEHITGNWAFEELIRTGRLFDTCKNKVQVVATGRNVDTGRLRKMSDGHLCKWTVEISCTHCESVLRFLSIPHAIHCVDSSRVSVRARKAAGIVKNALKGAEERNKPSPFITTIWATSARATAAAKMLRSMLPHLDIEARHWLDEDAAQAEVKLSCREFTAADAKGFDTYEVLHNKSADGEGHPSLIIHGDMALDAPEMSCWHAWFKNTSRLGGNGKNVECHTFFDPRKQMDVIVASNLRDMLHHKSYRYVIPFGLSFLRSRTTYDTKNSEETTDDENEEDDDEYDGFVMI